MRALARTNASVSCTSCAARNKSQSKKLVQATLARSRNSPTRKRTIHSATKGIRSSCPRSSYPSPVYSVALTPKTKTDLDKMGRALQRLAEEDPTLRVYREPNTNETIMSGMGDSHVDVAVKRLKQKFGVESVDRRAQNSVQRNDYQNNQSARAAQETNRRSRTIWRYVDSL